MSISESSLELEDEVVLPLNCLDKNYVRRKRFCTGLLQLTESRPNVGQLNHRKHFTTPLYKKLEKSWKTNPRPSESDENSQPHSTNGVNVEQDRDIATGSSISDHDSDKASSYIYKFDDSSNLGNYCNEGDDSDVE